MNIGKRLAERINKCSVILAIISIAVASSASVYAQEADTLQEQKIIPQLKFEAAELSSVLSIIASYSGTDIVPSSTVTGTITATIENKTWQQALDTVCALGGLFYSREKDYIVVLPKAEANGSQAGAPGGWQNLIAVKQKIVPVKNGSARDIAQSVRQLLSEQGSIVVLDSSNSLLVSDAAENLQQIEAKISRLDFIRTVRIEAKLLRINSAALKELDIAWNRLSGSADIGIAYDIQFCFPGEGQQKPADTKDSALAGPFSYAVLKPGDAKITDIYGTISGKNSRIMNQAQATIANRASGTVFLGEQIPVRTTDNEDKPKTRMIDPGIIIAVSPCLSDDGRVILKAEMEKKSYKVDPSIGLVTRRINSTNTWVVPDNGVIVLGGFANGGVFKTGNDDDQKKNPSMREKIFKKKKGDELKSDFIVLLSVSVVKDLKSGGAVPDTVETQ